MIRRGGGDGEGWVGKESSHAGATTHPFTVLDAPGAAICDPEAIRGGKAVAVISCARLGTAVSYPICRSAGGQAGCLDFSQCRRPAELICSEIKGDASDRATCKAGVIFFFSVSFYRWASRSLDFGSSIQ